MIALNSRAVNTSKVLSTSTPCYGQIVRLQHVVLPVTVWGQTRLLLQHVVLPVKVGSQTRLLLQHVVLPVTVGQTSCYCSRNEAISWFASVAYTVLPLTASP